VCSLLTQVSVIISWRRVLCDVVVYGWLVPVKGGLLPQSSVLPACICVLILKSN